MLRSSSYHAQRLTYAGPCTRPVCRVVCCSQPNKQEMQPGSECSTVKARRVHHVATAAAGALALALLLLPGKASAAFQLPPLPFQANATEPSIDGRTNELHHDVHHANYIKNVNNAIKNYTQLSNATLTELISQVGTGQLPSEVETAVRNNGGGSWNHNLWWNELAPYGSSDTSTSKISPALQEAINSSFGSTEAMLSQLQARGVSHFGSGWAWLVVPPGSSSKQLVITDTLNQDNPLMQIGGNSTGIPILGIDVWEHSFYLKYGPGKADFVKNWPKVVNWTAVSQNYDAARSGNVDAILGGSQYNKQQ